MAGLSEETAESGEPNPGEPAFSHKHVEESNSPFTDSTAMVFSIPIPPSICSESVYSLISVGNGELNLVEVVPYLLS